MKLYLLVLIFPKSDGFNLFEELGVEQPVNDISEIKNTVQNAVQEITTKTDKTLDGISEDIRN